MFHPAGEYAISYGSQKLSYPLLECKSCSHVFAHPQPSEAQLEKYYGSGFWQDYGVATNPEELSWRENVTYNSSLWERFERAKDQVQQIIRFGAPEKNASVIELGSGYAPVLYHLQQRGYKNLYALEPDRGICRYLEKQNVKTYDQLLESFIQNRSLVGKFDLIIISHTLEHVGDPALIIQGLREMLADKGILFIDVPHRDHLQPYHQGLHLQFFSGKSISILLNRLEFSEINATVTSLNVLDRLLLALLYRIYGQFFAKKKGVGSGSRMIELLHVALWRKLKKILGLNVNIYISKQDLRVLAKK